VGRYDWFCFRCQRAIEDDIGTLSHEGCVWVSSPYESPKERKAREAAERRQRKAEIREALVAKTAPRTEAGR
jgi:hypothetical protein